MKLGKDEVLHVAKLARIGMSDEEAGKFAPELSKILDYVEQLNEVDTEGVKETAIVTGTSNVLRKDVVTCKEKRDELLANSTLPKRGGQVLVDNVL